MNTNTLKKTLNVQDKVLFKNKKAVVLWSSVNYVDIEIIDTKQILQGVHVSSIKQLKPTQND